MEQFASGLYRLLFKFEIIRIQDNEYAVLVFAVGCASIGLLTVIADLAFYLLRGESLLEVKHSMKNTPLIGFAWALGALIIGYIGQVVSVFQVSLLACATVGVAWPVIFTQVLEKARKNEQIQQPSEEREA